MMNWNEFISNEKASLDTVEVDFGTRTGTWFGFLPFKGLLVEAKNDTD